MSSEFNKVKQVLGTFLARFIEIMEDTTDQLKDLQQEIDTFDKVNFKKPPPSVPEFKKEETSPLAEMEKLSKEIRDDVPKLLTRLKGIMGDEKEKKFQKLSEDERKNALKDMERAIKILSEEYDKYSVLEEEQK